MFSTPLTGDYVHHYSKDPAFDTESDNFDLWKWVECGDKKYIPRKQKRKPVTFKLRRLSAREAQKVYSLQGQSDQAWWAVALALRDIDPFKVDGKVRGLRFDVIEGFEVVHPDDMDLLFYTDQHQLFAELARRVLDAMTSMSPRN